MVYDACELDSMQASSPRAANGDVSKVSARAPRWRRVLSAVASIALLGAIILGLGFVWFVQHLPKGETTIAQVADGIVVLTGRASRIADAIELLAAKRGKRLLISGVYPTTTAHAIARLMPEHRQWFDCCVDLDHSAVNTVGNAIQARNWVKKYNFKSLIIVTSNYHMPRAMVELAHQMPEAELIAFPIAPERIRIESWWTSPPTTRMLFAEYLKYLRAVVRTRTSHVLGARNSS
jgi:uncharacterized SAM-binding protein YcdF (DUF218 family)